MTLDLVLVKSLVKLLNSSQNTIVEDVKPETNIQVFGFAVTPCVCQHDFVFLENCLAIYSTTKEYIFRYSGHFSFLILKPETFFKTV